jgi:hypothetical protein
MAAFVFRCPFSFFFLPKAMPPVEKEKDKENENDSENENKNEERRKGDGRMTSL